MCRPEHRRQQEVSVGILLQQLCLAVSTEKMGVPLPVKILRLLLSDLQAHVEASADTDEEGSECSGEEEADEMVKDMEALLKSEDGQWEEPEEDPDLHGDPMLQLDMQVYKVVMVVITTTSVGITTHRLIW